MDPTALPSPTFTTGDAPDFNPHPIRKATIYLPSVLFHPKRSLPHPCRRLPLIPLLQTHGAHESSPSMPPLLTQTANKLRKIQSSPAAYRSGALPWLKNHRDNVGASLALRDCVGLLEPVLCAALPGLTQNARQSAGVETYSELVYPQTTEFELIRLATVQASSLRTRKDLNIPPLLPL